MKKVILLSANLLIGASLFSQTLINYGKHSIGKVEFLKAFNKNKPTTEGNKEKALREYVDLYANFKMKVMEAMELRLDTAEQFKADVDNFRKQIVENYLSDEKTFNMLTDEAFTRSLSDLHVVRYSVSMDESASPEDSMAKYNAIKVAPPNPPIILIARGGQKPLGSNNKGINPIIVVKVVAIT
jgi:peptidyl-prolyl cis-trans isomerase SurA